MTHRKVITVIVALISCYTITNGQYIQWGNLKPGQYAIGYKTIALSDKSRTYLDAERPLQIHVWYPASKESINRTYMTFGDYFRTAAYDWGTNPQHVTYLEKYFRDGYKSSGANPSFPQLINEDRLQKIFNTTIPSIQNAAPDKGNFPLVLHSHVNGVLYQSVMMEYLASHGYVVASISQYNTSPAFYGRGEDGDAALINYTEDLALALSTIVNTANVDSKKIAMIGMMANVGLSLQMRGRPLQAIACLDCAWPWNDSKKTTQMPFYNEKKIRIPILEITNTEFGTPNNFLDSLPFSERYRFKFSKLLHADFYPLPKVTDYNRSKEYVNHEYILLSTLHFLNAVLKNDPDGRAFLNNAETEKAIPRNLLSINYMPAQKPIPTEEEFLTWLRYGEMEKVNIALKENAAQAIASKDNFFFTTFFLAVDNTPYAFDALKLYASIHADDKRMEMVFSRLGESFLREKKLKEAIELYSLFTLKFLDSPFAFDRLAEAYQNSGDKENMKTASQRVLDLLSKKASLTNEEKALVETARKRLNI